MEKHVVSLEMNGTTFSLETGRMAKQANGSVLVRMGDTMSLVTVTAADNNVKRWRLLEDLFGNGKGKGAVTVVFSGKNGFSGLGVNDIDRSMHQRATT